MSDINQLRYELQALVARYPDFQIDLSQIRVVQSVSLMQSQFLPQSIPNPFSPQPQQFQVAPPAQSIYYPPQPPARQVTETQMTHLINRPEGVEIVPPKTILPPIADQGIQEIAQKVVRESLSRPVKAKS